ncbi:MAG: DUF3429 domain-containing protein [Parvibaculales bacterium]
MTDTPTRTEIPLAALLLGCMGLLPFIVPALVALTPAFDLWRQVAAMFTLAYGAVILSFMAGIRWGTTMMSLDGTDPAFARGLSLSVVPALLAYFFLIFPINIWSPVGLAGLHVLQAASDIQAARNGDLPGWYAPLRLGLTIGAAASLLAVGLYQIGMA